MRSTEFSKLVVMMGQLDCETTCQQFVTRMTSLHGQLKVNFSGPSMLLYEELLRRAAQAVPGIRIPSFFDDDFLEKSFDADPSDYRIAFGLAMKHQACGNHARARQLLTRISNSGYKERNFARHHLAQLNADLPPLPHG